MLIYPADRIVDIQEAARLGIRAEVQAVDFASIMERTRRSISGIRERIRTGVQQVENLDFYEGMGHFTGKYTLQVGDRKIGGQKIFIASGARPHIPSMEGIEEVDYLTNENVLELVERPASLIIIGGGYIGVEYGHFFAAMGTKVTILTRNEHLVPEEEPEISGLLRRRLSERMEVRTAVEAVRARREDGGCTITATDLGTGQERDYRAEKVLIAAGRTSNADLLKAADAGLELDGRGYIKVNEYLETSAKNIWAFGDAIGQHMFTHVANKEVALVWHNSTHDQKIAMDYSAVPHAVFSHPQIAAVGLTEEEAKKDHTILVGTARYSHVAKGEAMMETDGFAKAVIDRMDDSLLGFHIIGPHAPILIQEVVNAMAADGKPGWIYRGMHIHPSLSELILSTLGNLREVS
jgi:dihydrolipoamide dehydrogenase